MPRKPSVPDYPSPARDSGDSVSFTVGSPPASDGFGRVLAPVAAGVVLPAPGIARSTPEPTARVKLPKGTTQVLVAATLAQRIESARAHKHDLDEVTDLLNTALAKAQRAIIGLRLGVSARVNIDEEDENDDGRHTSELAFMKDGGEWGLFIVSSHDHGMTEKVTPLVESTKWARFRASKALPKLVDAMIENASKQVVDAMELVDEVEAFTNTLEKA